MLDIGRDLSIRLLGTQKPRSESLLVSELWGHMGEVRLNILWIVSQIFPWLIPMDSCVCTWEGRRGLEQK